LELEEQRLQDEKEQQWLQDEKERDSALKMKTVTKQDEDGDEDEEKKEERFFPGSTERVKCLTRSIPLLRWIESMLA
jgi:hypothetical protein